MSMYDTPAGASFVVGNGKVIPDNFHLQQLQTYGHCVFVL
jgi:hypothetical protein